MVLRVCRGTLRDEHAAHDAFQATFLALARHGGSLWTCDSVAPWLHRVTRRVAVRARADARRRQVFEGRAAELAIGRRVDTHQDHELRSASSRRSRGRSVRRVRSHLANLISWLATVRGHSVIEWRLLVGAEQ
jgi:DNA-directed RNA polymerase specialized sigma24 family protein